jgi:hypothetical protein
MIHVRRIPGRSPWPWVAVALVAGCKHEAEIRGTLAQAGKGVPYASVVLGCPDGSKHVTSTSTTGEFRFEDVGAGVDDGCVVEVSLPGTWIPPQAVGPRCRTHDAATGLCTEVILTFETR